MTENQLSEKVIGTAIQLHRNVGPGLLESVYENALAFDLRESGLEVKQQVAVPFVYKEIRQEVGFRLDLLVEDKLVVEVKAVEEIAPVHFSQTLTYLRLTRNRLGLLINFNTKLLKDGVHRVANGM